jgi:hypothetical protein
MVACQVCGGDGQRVDGSTCGACGGSGQLESNSEGRRWLAENEPGTDTSEWTGDGSYSGVNEIGDQERLYGIESSWIDKEPGQFNKIKDSLREATERGTYKPYFQMQHGAREGSFLSSISKQKSTGFASQDPTMMNMMEDEYARGMVGIAEDIQGKMNSAQQSIDQIVQGNQQTILTLRQLEKMG